MIITTSSAAFLDLLQGTGDGSGLLVEAVADVRSVTPLSIGVNSRSRCNATTSNIPDLILETPHDG